MRNKRKMMMMMMMMGRDDEDKGAVKLIMAEYRREGGKEGMRSTGERERKEG